GHWRGRWGVRTGSWRSIGQGWAGKFTIAAFPTHRRPPMIRSMTAYASAETGGAAGTLSCELRTVNHRYLELSPRLPDELRSLESQLRERIAARLSRGKVDVTVRSSDSRSESLQVDNALLSRLSELNLDMQARFPGMQLQFTELLRFPGVLQQDAADPEARQAALFEVLDRALDAIERIVAQVREWMPEIRAALRTRLEARLADLKQPADPGRLEQELVLQITRSDVDEELDRLSTHITETRRVLGLKEPVGRRLDFLMQEFNREANTLGSKSVDA